MTDIRSNELIVADAIRATEVYDDMPPADVAAEVVAALIATGRLAADRPDADYGSSEPEIRCRVCGAEIALGGDPDSGQIRPWVEYPGGPPADDHEHAPSAALMSRDANLTTEVPVTEVWDEGFEAGTTAYHHYLNGRTEKFDAASRNPYKG